ncbi:MFS transporter [Paractinoplanes hotanensis]|uniref:MFS transporter n=1 Tax=Paractinoplanes hotanensis TaxID=2906497 RepID=A0ABT0YDP2_9ACTN|nr:MFS transporter [Actinoplanes hotanensis]MCM4084166.1 MFS transporter [Actinoplanes hotanensis]
MLQLDAQVVTVALPRLQTELGFSVTSLSWVPNAYALAFGGLLLLGGRLGDVLGRVRVFTLGTAIFALASVLAGVAQEPTTMIVARVLQGVGSAVAAPSILALVVSLARTQRERTRGLTLFTAASAVGSSVGLILGGLLTTLASWRWGLLINLPIGLFVVLVVRRVVPEIDRHRGSIDVPGAVTVTGGSVALIFGLLRAAEISWTDPVTVIAFAVAAVLLTACVFVERRAVHPLIDAALLRNRARTGALTVMGATVGAHFAMIYLVVQYDQRGLEFDPLQAGLAFLPLTVTVLVLSQIVPPLLSRVGAQALTVAGTLLVTLSFVGFAMLDAGSSYLTGVLPALLVHSVGVAFVFNATTVEVMSGLENTDTGAMSGLLQTGQQLGGSFGIAVAVATIAATGGRSGETEEFIDALPAGFQAAGVVALLAALVAAFTMRTPKRRSPATPSTT